MNSGNTVLESMSINNWLLIFPKFLDREAKFLSDQIHTVYQFLPIYFTFNSVY